MSENCAVPALDGLRKRSMRQAGTARKSSVSSGQLDVQPTKLDKRVGLDGCTQQPDLFTNVLYAHAVAIGGLFLVQHAPIEYLQRCQVGQL